MTDAAPEQGRMAAGAVIVCYSKCLWCGRQTPHEVCHAHSSALGFDPGTMRDDEVDDLWNVGFYQEPETCNDPACPVWEPGEWDRLQAEAAMTPEQRRERTERIKRQRAERRAAYDAGAGRPAGGEEGRG